MPRRITRTALLILALAAGVAGSSAAHPAKARVCGSLASSPRACRSAWSSSGATTCKTAKKVLRAYLRSDAPCGRLGVRARALRLHVRERQARRMARHRRLQQGPQPDRRLRPGRLIFKRVPVGLDRRLAPTRPGG